MNYEAIRLVVTDFHVVRGKPERYRQNHFGYLLGGGQVFDTGSMDALRRDPNYLCPNDCGYRIKLRCLDPARLEEFFEIFTNHNRGDQIVERTVVGTFTKEDEDADTTSSTSGD